MAKNKEKRPLMDQGKKDFIQGYACAAGVMGYLDGHSDTAQEIIRQGGFTREDLLEADIEDIDYGRIYGKSKPKKYRK